MYRKVFSYALLLLCPAFMNAADVVYSTTSNSNNSYGTSKAEAYDVAVHLTDAGFVGKSIKSVEIPVRTNDAISDYSVFLTKALKVSKGVNVPDIVSVTTEPADGKLIVTFDEPYTITDEGVYVGYSLTVNSVDDTSSSAPTSPIVGEYKSADNEFWLHAKRSVISWKDKSSLSFTPSIKVYLSGEFPDNAAGIKLKSGLKGVVNKESSISATISNYGVQQINDIDVAYQVNGQNGSAHIAFDDPIAAQYTLSKEIVIPVSTSDIYGTQNLTITVTKVNGEENGYQNASATSDITFYSFVPKHRAIMEEFTGTWCGWCPRGFAAMKYLNANQPDFIGIAYHYSDIMQCSNPVPNNPGSYPSCQIDRQSIIDPYYGSSGSYFNIGQEWLDRCDVMAPADIDLDASFDSEDSDIITVKSTVTFCFDIDNANYMIGYALIADDLCAPNKVERATWKQTNYYSGYDASGFIDEMKQFCEGNSSVYDLHFDDVVIYDTDVLGVAGSIPSTVKDSEPIEGTYTIDTSLANSVYKSGYSLVQDRSKLRVVAVLIDADGSIVNANVTNVYGGVSAVNEIAAPDEVVATEYYDLSGRRISKPSAGLYIRKATHSNGSVTTDKLFVK